MTIGPTGIDNEIIAAFLKAAVENRPKAMQLIELHPALRDVRWTMGGSLLHALAAEGQAEAVRFLGLLGFDPNTPNDFGDAPIIDAAAAGDDRVAEALLAVGANPNALSSTRDNAIHAAVRTGNATLVAHLLKAGARTSYITEMGEKISDALPAEAEKRAAVMKVLEGATDAGSR